MKGFIFVVTACLALSASQSAFAFSLSFEWGNLKKCTSGSPNTVTNPTFVLDGVPGETTKLRFKMTDRDAPDYQHGGGTVDYSGATTIGPGAFKYQSPCPPDGSHTYQWTVTALDAAGKSVGSAKASKHYP